MGCDCGKACHPEGNVDGREQKWKNSACQQTGCGSLVKCLLRTGANGDHLIEALSLHRWGTELLDIGLQVSVFTSIFIGI